MKKIILPIVAVSALAAATVPAAAMAQPVNQRQAQLEQRIDRGVRTGDLTRVEARRLHGELREVARLEYRYRAGGLNSWERRDLDRRLDRVSAQIRYERNDRDYGHGYGRGGPNRW